MRRKGGLFLPGVGVGEGGWVGGRVGWVGGTVNVKLITYNQYCKVYLFSSHGNKDPGLY